MDYVTEHLREHYRFLWDEAVTARKRLDDHMKRAENYAQAVNDTRDKLEQVSQLMREKGIAIPEMRE